MPLLRGSLEADVPVSFADREQRESVGRSVYGRFPAGYEDLRSSLADLDAYREFVLRRCDEELCRC